ncbi:MAG: type I-E CRISPR-associated endoribonuclease Cas2e [Cyanobacteriota bacterium]
MILENVPTALRGELSRWLTPVGGGVHVGRVSALVRDQLWNLAVTKAGQGRVIQIWHSRGEPGYALRVHGLVDAELVDLEGLPMIAVKDAAWREAMNRFTVRPKQAMLGQSEKTSGPITL